MSLSQEETEDISLICFNALTRCELLRSFLHAVVLVCPRGDIPICGDELAPITIDFMPLTGIGRLTVLRMMRTIDRA